MIGTSSSTIYSKMNLKQKKTKIGEIMYRYFIFVKKKYHFEDEDSTSEAGPLSREPPAPVTSQ